MKKKSILHTNNIFSVRIFQVFQKSYFLLVLRKLLPIVTYIVTYCQIDNVFEPNLNAGFSHHQLGIRNLCTIVHIGMYIGN